MKKNIVVILILLAGTLLFVQEPVEGNGPIALLAPQNVTNINGHMFVENEPTPFDQVNMIVRWQNNQAAPGNAISQAVTYDPSNYTGFSPPSPRSSWQRGQFDDAVNGSPVFQLQGTSGGMLMNSWFTTYQPIIGGGQNTVYEYKFSNPPAPWTSPAAKLWVQGDLKLPWFAHWDNNNNGNWPVGQLSYFFYLKDVTTNTGFCYIVNAYDNRPFVPVETILTDTFTYFASTYFGGTKYVTPNAYSGTWRHSTWDSYVFYRAEVRWDDLAAALTDANAAYSVNLSVDPADYVLTSVGILQETFREDGDQVSMGSSFRNFGVYVDS